jgi:hypothetical protein
MPPARASPSASPTHAARTEFFRLRDEIIIQSVVLTKPLTSSFLCR